MAPLKEKWIPSPLALALGLSLLVLLIATIFSGTGGFIQSGKAVLGFWYSGFWDLLAFTMQMVLILILGHILARSPLIEKLLDRVVSVPESAASSTMLVCFLTLLVSFFNWGLGLVFGAVLARKVGEHAVYNGRSLNYPLLGAAGYSGLMFWHGGLSGSAPLAVARTGHFLETEMGVLPVEQTIFSANNLLVSLCILILLPAYFYWQAGRSKVDLSSVPKKQGKDSGLKAGNNWLLTSFGVLMLLASLLGFFGDEKGLLGHIGLNSLNFLLFALCLIFLGNMPRFENALGEASLGAAGILVQFPLYAGIMAVMRDSGLMAATSQWFSSISNAETFPILSYLSAAILNVLVPSGGGQWAVQGPIAVQAAQDLGIPIKKVVMAVAYGDQLTNMIQPFWALPLLGITKLKPLRILPYTFKIMLIGGLVYLVGILMA